MIYASPLLGRLWGYLVERPRVRKFLTALLVPDGETDVELFGATLRVHKRRESAYLKASAIARGTVVFRHESGSLLSLALILQPGDTFVDVGANVGLYTGVLSRLLHLHPDMRFYAFEPNPDTARRLRASLRGRNVQIVECALSDRDGVLDFEEGVTSGDFAVGRHRTDPACRIPTRRLDSLDIAGDSIVMKVDVEGHERQVLDGASGLLKAGRVKAVYLDGYSDPTIPARLTALGFRLFDGRTMTPEAAPPCSLLAIRTR